MIPAAILVHVWCYLTSFHSLSVIKQRTRGVILPKVHNRLFIFAFINIFIAHRPSRAPYNPVRRKSGSKYPSLMHSISRSFHHTLINFPSNKPLLYDKEDTSLRSFQFIQQHRAHFLTIYSQGSASGVQGNDKGTQTSNLCLDITKPRPFMDASFPKKKTHPISHKVMLLSAVLSLAQKQKISGEVESTLLYYVSFTVISNTHHCIYSAKVHLHFLYRTTLTALTIP